MLVVLSSPSGGGKTTIVEKILQQNNDRFVRSVSVTTRPARAGEVNGKDYHFISAEKFEQMRRNQELVEWAVVHGHYYGTPSAKLRRFLRQDKVVLLAIDIEGAEAIRNKYPLNSLLIFIMPPSIEVLKKRLRERRSDTKQEIQKRLERVEREMRAAPHFDYQVTNHDLQETVREVIRIISIKIQGAKHN